MTENPLPDSSALRARLQADIAAGRTVSLAAFDLAQPGVRHQLPKLLEELTAAMHAPPAPVRIPGFTLLGEIGRGGMSTVYLARQDALDRHVALKVAPKWLAGDARLQQRLLQEARAMARLSHPNIVAIHDILEVDDVVAIAMDWIDGMSLSALLARLLPHPHEHDMATMRKALGSAEGSSPTEATATTFFVRVVRDIARALHHVHGAGLLHLDIKPSNILVRRDGMPLLADFGVVRDIDLASTHTQTFAGTPVYSAPEQLQREDSRFGPHTDVYGLGITLYEMLARVQPLRQLSLTRVLHDVLGGRIAPLATHVPIPADLANIVHKAIAPEPQHRYANADALADDLTAFLEHRPVQARPLTRAQRLRRWARNEPWKALLAAVLLVTVPALIGLGGYLQLQMPRIELARLEERRMQASDLKQAAFQEYFVTHSVDGEPTRMLEEAMALDPGPTSLACLLAMSHEEGLASTDVLLERHRNTVEMHLGLRLFAAKVAAGRSFFTTDEAEQLRLSPHLIDKYVLALDLVLQAEDREVEEAYRAAELGLDEAAMLANVDPLLVGLRLWVAHRSEAPERFAGIARAIEARWASDPRMLSWLYYSLEPFDPDAARTLAEQWQQQHPHATASWEMLSGGAYRSQDFQRALAHVQAADAAGVYSPKLEMYRLLSQARLGGVAEAARALKVFPTALLTEGRRLSLLRLVDPEAADKERAQLLQRDPRSAPLLLSLFRDAKENKHTAHTDLAWKLWHQHHPDRFQLHIARIGILYGRRDVDGAAALLAEITLPRRAEPVVWRLACSVLVTANDWVTLARYGHRWHDLGEAPDLPEATFFTALAELRLGHLGAAKVFLAEALADPDAKRHWYGNALVEDAWLRVAPDAPAAWRDPALATRRIDELDERFGDNPKFPMGAWTYLVRAEVAFASGDRSRAIELAEKGIEMAGNGRRTRVVEPQAPADCKARLEEALARYRKQ